MNAWDNILTERDKQVFKASGFSGKIGLGRKPAFVIIDVTYDFVGDKPEPILTSIKRFPFSCGEEGWAAVRVIESLLPIMREKEIPIIYIYPDRSPKPEGWLRLKNKRYDYDEVIINPKNNQIVQEIAPTKKDIVISKPRSSMFFGTPLMAILNGMKIDSLIVCGVATSACVRASVVDAHANNFRVALIEEATFDRGQISHLISLFDLNAKYADVVSVEEIIEYIHRI